MMTATHSPLFTPDQIKGPVQMRAASDSKSKWWPWGVVAVVAVVGVGVGAFVLVR